MGAESFKNLYPVLQALADGPDDSLHTAVWLLGKADRESLKNESQTVLGMLDNYEEPKLPFADVTKGQVDKAFKDLEDTYGFVVWSNELAGSDEDCAARVNDDPDYFLGMAEDIVRQISYEAYAEDRDLLKGELDKAYAGPILVIGAIGRWDGHKGVYAVKRHLSDIFSVFYGDVNALYIKDNMLRAENSHHDGTDSFSVYIFKDGFDPYTAENKEALMAQAVSVVPALDKYFGWKCGEKGGTL